MADMYGALRSNEFKVNDVEAFKKWFEENCYFGDEIEIWERGESTVAFGGYEMYPCAYPRMASDECYQDEWNLKAFADEVRQHLQPGESLRVLAGGHEKLRYVSFQHLVITHDTETFTEVYEGN
jgi:hypothetical protein